MGVGPHDAQLARRCRSQAGVSLAGHTSYRVKSIAWMTSYYYVPGIESMKLTFSAAGKSERSSGDSKPQRLPNQQH